MLLNENNVKNCFHFSCALKYEYFIQMFSLKKKKNILLKIYRCMTVHLSYYHKKRMEYTSSDKSTIFKYNQYSLYK